MPHLSLRFARSLAFALLAIPLAPAAAQLPFFPGAEGYGGAWSGTAPAGGWLSNATVYHVTNLNDSGPGSFRGAFGENTSNKIIVFDVGGTIQLTSGVLDIKNLANYYIAGQTAPSPVTIYGDMVRLTHSGGKENRNVALRYLSFRKGVGPSDDAVTFAGSGLGTNLILDHVSASWSEDEVLSVANNNTDVTVQYSTIHDALVTNHAYGSLIRPRIDSNVAFHHNLYAHNASRQARFGTYNGETLTADFRNNVIYNWRDRASYAGGSSEDEREFADVNYVGNYLIAGPGTTGSPSRAFTVDQNMDARVHQSDNFIDSDKTANPGGVPNGSNTGWAAFGLGGAGSPIQTLTQMATPFATPAVTTQTAADAYRTVLETVGNSAAGRDAIDQRLINNVRNFTGPPLAAAAPSATELSELLSRPMTTRPAGYDSDNDGMPDAWETKYGLNPNSPAGTPDWKLDFDNDGYINLIEFVNEAGEFPATAPIVFTGATNNRYAQITNWKTDDGVTAGSNWQPGKYDGAEIRSGTAVVDAVGQRAWQLALTPQAGESATLNITGGWLEVGSDIYIPAVGTATVNQSGGLVRASTLGIDGVGSGVAAYNLSGGALEVTNLANGNFHFTGGTLQADVILTSFVNNGGTLSPGGAQRATVVMGDFMNASGSIKLDLSGPSIGQFDRIVVDNTLTAGGVLDVDLAPGYVPAVGATFKILNFTDATGEFALDLPALVDLQWNAAKLLTTGELVVQQLGSADFNADGQVDGSDLLVWQRGLGATSQQESSRGDANRDGAVDALDLAAWQTQAAGGAIVASAPVPEPAAAALAIVALLCGAQVSRSSRRR